MCLFNNETKQSNNITLPQNRPPPDLRTYLDNMTSIFMQISEEALRRKVLSSVFNLGNAKITDLFAGLYF